MRGILGSVQKRVTVGVLLPIAILFAALSYRHINQMSWQIEKRLADQLRRIVTTASLGIDGDRHAALTSTLDEDYTKIRDWLRRVKKANALDAELNTMEAVDQHLRYVVTSKATPNYRVPYLMRPAIRQALNSGKPQTTSIYQDEYGSWLSAYAPIKNSQGRTVAVLEAKVTAETVLVYKRNAIFFTMGSGLLMLLLASIIAAVLARRLARPVQALVEIVRGLEQGDPHFEDRVPPETGTEFDELVERTIDMGYAVMERERETLELIRRLTELDHLKDAFLSSISHELRTPIMAIISYSEMVRSFDDITQVEAQEFLEILHHSALRLGYIVEQVLDFSRFQAMPENQSNVSFIDLVSDVVRQYEQDAADSNVTIEVDYNVSVEEESNHIEVNRTRRALSCLLDNAIRHSDDGDRVLVSVVEDSIEGHSIIIENFGPPIAEEHQDMIFEPFYQVGDILVSKPQGIGLGLALARVCMRSQGGDVLLEKSDEDSTVFSLLFEVEEMAVA